MKPTALIVTDSRGKHFNHLLRQDTFCDKELFHDIKVIAISGAQVNGIANLTLQFVNTVHCNRTLIVKIAVGINNFTKKYRNRWRETEISLSNQTVGQVYSDLIRLKHQIISVHPKSVVTICTIAAANLLKVQQVSKERNKLRHPSHTEDELWEKTNVLMVKLEDINRKIFISNQTHQLNITPQTASLDKYVIRGKPKGKKRLTVSALPDGVHGSQRVEQNWLNSIWKSILKELKALQNA